MQKGFTSYLKTQSNPVTNRHGSVPITERKTTNFYPEVKNPKAVLPKILEKKKMIPIKTNRNEIPPVFTSN